MLRKLKTYSLAALPFLCAIVHLFHDMACYVTMLWVPSKLNIADAPSRRFHRGCYTMPPWVVSDIRARYRPEVQVFGVG